jgi:hypothetical protein
VVGDNSEVVLTPKLHSRRWSLFSNVSTVSATRKNIYIIVGMLLGAMLLAVVMYRPSAPITVGVGFLGYTNGVTGYRLAKFALTNQSGVTIRRWGCFDRQVKGSPLLAFTLPLGSDVLLSPGQVEVILVPLNAERAFNYHRNWRAVFYWRREGWQTRFQLWVNSLAWVSTMFPGRGIRVQGARSEWIDQ